ncbi:porin [Pandoraea sp. NPDC090278]|uniref:porin n=1 Tax=Pandoraea sp. NPDC090278 TaxID=3364391 RepID=UPI00383A4CEE
MLATGMLLGILGIACTTAHAQVQLYGAIDNYVSYDSGGKGGSTQVGSGAGATSRFGFTGTEDLGGGLQSGFRLESGLNTANGTLQSTNTIFNREANLWLSSHELGMLKIGRQFPTIFPLSAQVDPFALTKFSLLSNMVYQTSDLGGGAVGIDSRVPNAVSYTTPDFGGFTAQVLYATSTATPSGSPPHTTGVLGQYDDGRLYVGASYNLVRNDFSQTTDHYGAGMSYKLGATVLSFAWNRIVPREATGRIVSAYLLGATIPFDVHVIKISLVERLVAGGGNHAFGALGGYEYLLSKRTALYTRVGWIDNNGASALTLDNAQAAAGRDVFVTALGITHRF